VGRVEERVIRYRHRAEMTEGARQEHTPMKPSLSDFCGAGVRVLIFALLSHEEMRE
jgi:hypothetical protein